MISKVQISGFKNYGIEKNTQTIIFEGKDLFLGSLTCIVGRNGSGKSAIIDAIEWCCFPRDLTTTSAAESNKIVNRSKNSVSVEFVSDHGLNKLVVQRSISNKMVRLKYLKSGEGHFREATADELRMQLLEFGIDSKNFNRILVKQNDATISCQRPLEILQFIERCVGLSDLGPLIQKHRSREKHLLQEIQNLIFESANQRSQQLILEPQIQKIFEYRADEVLTMKLTATYFNDVISATEQDIASYKKSIDDCDAEMEIFMDQCKRNLSEISRTSTELQSVTKRLIFLRKQEDKLRKMKLASQGKIHQLSLDLKKNTRSLSKLEKSLQSTRELEGSLSHSISRVLQSKLKYVLKQINKSQRELQVAREELLAIFDDPSISSGEGRFEGILETVTLCRQRVRDTDKDSKLVASLNESLANNRAVLLQLEASRAIVRDNNDRAMREIARGQVELESVGFKIKAVKNSAEAHLKTMRETQEQLGWIEKQLLLIEDEQRDRARDYSRSQVNNRLQRAVQSLFAEEGGGVFGILCDLIRPVDPSVAPALLVVLGRSLETTVVVRSRDRALAVANQCRAHHVFDVAIAIVDELESDRADSKTKRLDLGEESYVDLVDLVECLNSEVYPALRKRLDNWKLFRGNYEQLLLPQGNISYNGFNVVSLDGYRLYQDGEIRTKSRSSSSRQAWPVGIATVASGGRGGRDEQLIGKHSEKDMSQLRQKRDLLIHLTEQQKHNQSDLAKKLAALEKLFKEMEGRISKLKCAVKGMESVELHDSKVKELTARIKFEVNKISEIEAKNKVHQVRLAAELDLIREEFGGSVDADALCDVVERKNIAQKQLQQLQSSERLLLNEIKSHQRRLKDLEKKQEDLKRLIELTRDQLIEKKAVQNLAENECHMISEDIDGYCNRISSLNLNIQQLREYQKQRGQQKKSLDCKVAQLTGNLEKLHSLIDTLSSERRAAISEMEATRDRIHISFDALRTLALSPWMRLVESHFSCCSNILQTETQGTNNEVSVPRTKLELAVIEKKLDLEKSALETRWESLDEAATLKKYEDFYSISCQIESQIVALTEEAQSHHTEANTLQAQRYNSLMAGLRKINQHLGIVYKQLHADADCYLNYSPDSVSVFEEGVSIQAQHAGGSWKEAHRLSGGQQASCGVALLLSIHAVFPSPIYIMDEVDAALDVRTVTRLGQLIREKARRTRSQFIMVSHRPELHIFATNMVGVYCYNGFPKSITYSFDDELEANEGSLE